MKMRMVFGIALGLLVASMSPVSAHDMDAEPPVADAAEDEPSAEWEDEVQDEEEDSSHLLWYDVRKLHQASEIGFDFFKEIRLQAHGFETAKQEKAPYIWNQTLIAEISLRPWSWAFQTPLTDEENRIEVGVYARYQIQKFRTRRPDRFRWYESYLSLGVEFAYVNFDEQGAEWMITIRPCAYVAEERGKSADSSNTYELSYQNSGGFEISGIFEYYGLFRPLERGSRSGFFPTVMLEGGYAEHRGEKLKSTLSKANQIDKPHNSSRSWFKSTFWLFQYDFKGLLISIGGSAFGDEVRAGQFRYPDIRENRKVRTFTAGPSIRIVILDRLLFEGTFQYGRIQKLGDHIRYGKAGMGVAF